MRIKLCPHPVTKLVNICDGVQHATQCQAVGILGQQGRLYNTPPVVGCLEVWILHMHVRPSLTIHTTKCFSALQQDMQLLLWHCTVL